MRILIATDNTICREGLQCLLEAMPKCQVIGETGSGRDAVRLAREKSPDIVLMDVSLPELNGVDATRRITGGNSRTKVLGIAGDAENQV